MNSIEKTTTIDSTDPCDLILVAGGAGVRFGAAGPKQFEDVAGKPLLFWSLETFKDWKPLRHVVVVVPADKVEEVRKSLPPLSIGPSLQITAGGKSRKESSQLGLQALDRVSEGKWVMIHDAVRPCVTLELVERVWNARNADAELGGVIPALPVRETIKAVTPSRIVERTFNRDVLYAVQTPQLLRRALLKQAFEKFADENVADDASLVEKLGYKVVVVDGDHDNVKVTFKEDMERVSHWLGQRHS